MSYGDFRGFQFGDPSKAPYDTHVDLFDSSDRHFAIDVGGEEGHGQVLTQEELNAVVASILPSTTKSPSASLPSSTPASASHTRLPHDKK
jgi:hypothetical protein